jgi:hypothetical protein
MSTNKNAYEIRADILSMAQGHIQCKYDKDYLIWESTATRHPESGNILSKEGAPEFPTTEAILKAAHDLYSFVDAKV